MNINCTLLFQMLHFGIAYIILKRFLFKPTLSVIEKEADYERSLHKTIQERVTALVSKKQEMSQAWELFYQQEAALPISHTKEVSEFPLLQERGASSEQLVTLKQEVVTACLAKVDHVGW
jgi:hypothetical protein